MNHGHENCMLAHLLAFMHCIHKYCDITILCCHVVRQMNYIMHLFTQASGIFYLITSTDPLII